MKYTKTKYTSIYTYQTANGLRYYVRRIHTIHGKRKEATASGLKTLAEARTALAEIEQKIKDGSFIINKNLTVDQYWRQYSDNRIKTGRWSPDTEVNKEEIYRSFFKVQYGHMRLADLSRFEYEAYINSKLTRYTRHTVNQAHGVLNAMMNDAEHNGFIDKNVIDHIFIGESSKPKHDKRLSLEDFKTWDTVARQTLDDYDYLTVRLTYLGLRRSEVCGVKLESIRTLENGRIYLYIDESRTRNRPNGNGMKTKSSERAVAVDELTAELLQKAVETSHEIAKRSNQILASSDFLIRDKDTDGKPIHIRRIVNLFSSVSKLADLHVTPHMMRHFFATQGVLAGVPIEHMAAALGHSTSYMTEKYTHIQKEVTTSVTDSFMRAIK